MTAENPKADASRMPPVVELRSNLVVDNEVRSRFGHGDSGEWLVSRWQSTLYAEINQPDREKAGLAQPSRPTRRRAWRAASKVQQPAEDLGKNA
jgi:hypothetical protein